MKQKTNWRKLELPASSYLIACDESVRERQKELLYETVGPVFFGNRKAVRREELDAFYLSRYGIDVKRDFCEGDDHYEEYQEAVQAIAEGMTVYGGEIVFEDGMLAELAEEVWERMETGEKKGFRRINTMLEE